VPAGCRHYPIHPFAAIYGYASKQLSESDDEPKQLDHLCSGVEWSEVKLQAAASVHGFLPPPVEIESLNRDSFCPANCRDTQLPARTGGLRTYSSPIANGLVFKASDENNNIIDI
jgi:hypothetical protein